MRQPKIHSQKQSGQAIVLIAILMVALIGSLGLAIDGGGMYLLYRDAQNAVDAAALTSAFALCTGGDVEEAGYHSLELNGFERASLSADSGVFTPPRDPEYASETTMVEIILDVDKPSYFIQIVYGGSLNVTVSAISECAGSPGVASSGNRDEQYAFSSLRETGQCTSSPAWDIAGSQFTIEGDVWMPRIGPNIEFHDNVHEDPTTADNPADILGNIYIGMSEAAHPDLQQPDTRWTLVEDLPGSPAGDPFLGIYTGYGGDGNITFDEPSPGPLEYTNMDYYRPAGSIYCSAGSTECGGLQSVYGDGFLYHDISGSCDHGAINNQDFLNPSTVAGAFYDKDTHTWTAGIYYSTCDITLDDANMTGNVTFISEEYIIMNSSQYHLTSFGDAPLIVTDWETTSNVNDCTSSGQVALYINAPGGSYLQGRIIAYNGQVEIGGGDYVFETCITATGIKQNGNSNSIYQCTPSMNDAQREVRLIK